MSSIAKLHHECALRNCVMIGVMILLTSCSNPKESAEAWISLPVSEWPDMALTNEIVFEDTTFTDLANCFLVRYAEDTFAVTCKHIFLVFRNRLGYQDVHLGEDFQSWWMYPENKPDMKFRVGKLLNDDPNESIGEFNTLKDRDWLVFEVQDVPKEIHVFQLAEDRPFSGEAIYNFGWGDDPPDPEKATLVKMEFIRAAGNQLYAKTLTAEANGVGRSGSAVFNARGHLLGLVSGAEGQLGVVCSTSYLEIIF